MARKVEISALKQALSKVDSLVAAARGEESSCGVFRPELGGGEFTEGQKLAVAIYVESWIREPLVAALRGIEGEREWNNERLLEGYHTGFARWGD